MLHARLTVASLLICALIAQTTTAGDSQKKGEKKVTPGKQIAVVSTSMGSFEIELFGADAPKTVENFAGLAGKKFFDGMRVHRVVKGFVIQTGDDKSKDTTKMIEWGTGGKSIWGKEFADELNPSTPSYKAGYLRGTVAMANRGPNTNTSQFFVMLADNTSLPKAYTIFGKVVSGMDVVDKIGSAEIVPLGGASDGRPRTEILVESVTIRTEKTPTK
jgi:cyclophilin family peptidyl-prolyl cis-trans isomerase